MRIYIYIYIYIGVCIYVNICICMYIYIYIYMLLCDGYAPTLRRRRGKRTAGADKEAAVLLVSAGAHRTLSLSLPASPSAAG